MASNSTSLFRTSSTATKKELISKATPQTTKQSTKFAFNVFDGKSNSHFINVTEWDAGSVFR